MLDLDEMKEYLDKVLHRLDKIHQQREHREHFLRVIRKGTFVNNEILATPFVNQMFLCQSLATNGIPKKSPLYNLRTNTGFLVASVAKEAFGQEPFNGAAVILPGEWLIFEPSEEGFYDFALSFEIVPFVRDEGIHVEYGKSNELLSDRNLHEIDRDFPNGHYDRQLDLHVCD